MLLSQPASRRGLARAALLGAAAGALPLALARARPASSEVSLEHAAPACLLAESTSRLVACLQPRSQKGTLRVLFRAAGGEAWYTAALRSDVPCYSGLLPRPSRGTQAVEYVIEAEGAFGVVRSPAHTALVVADVAACAGRTAPLAAGRRASWEAPTGAPRTPPGFEGAAPPRPSPGDRTASRPSATPPPKAPTPAPPSVPTAPRTPAPAPPPPADAGAGGHGLRNAALIVGGAAVVGGGALAVASGSEGSDPPATTGPGLPTSGVSGVYTGVETVDYGSGCTGTDDIVLNLQEAGGALSGVLSFTVRSCPCCSTGRGANPVRGVLAGTTLQLATPGGFAYQGAFAGNRLSGSLAGPGGIRGSWTVDKR